MNKWSIFVALLAEGIQITKALLVQTHRGKRLLSYILEPSSKRETLAENIRGQICIRHFVLCSSESKKKKVAGDKRSFLVDFVAKT